MKILHTLRYPLKAFLFILLSLQIHAVKAQMIPAPVWTATYSKSEVKTGDEVELIFKASLQEPYYVYSTETDPNLGPMIPEIEWVKHPSYKVTGKLYSVGAKTKYDDTWESNVSIFKTKAELRIKVKILSANPVIQGDLTHSMCNESTCVPITVTLKLPPLKVSGAVVAPPKNEKDGTNLQGEEVSADTTDQATAATPPATVSKNDSNKTATTVIEEEIPDDDIRNKSLLGLFLLGFAAGFLAILTPCVFPMIPMTVAFFTKKQDKRKGRQMALFYGLSIITIYVGIGLLLSAVLGAAFGYTLSTHWLPNMLFFAIFMVFGASFFGAFELVLPSSFVNNIDKKSDKGGYVGVFFIALTLVVISFSCTVPLVGSVAILAENGELIRPMVAMLGFSSSFALPFTFFAFFPQWLNSLPKSGGWLNSVKVVFGFIEVALALKFFSQADLAYHWGILDRDVFLSFWIILSILLGFYLFGKLKFSHDSEVKHISVPRFFLGLVAFSFGVYMIPGLWGAPLKPLAGILPPLSAQDWKGSEKESATKHENSKTAAFSMDTVKYADKLHLPHGLQGFYDYKQGLAAVKKLGKPALLDFSGHSCSSCRRMEENVWSVPEVLAKMKEDIIIISLYADEKLEVPENEWYTSTRDQRVKKTLGEQNLDLEINKYGENAQPMYFIVDGEGNPLSKFNGYKNDPEGYIAFIDKGVKKFYENQGAK